MKRYLPFVIVAGVGLVALGSGAILYRAKRPQLRAIPEDKALSGTTGDESLHIRGNPNALVTIEEFGDFQCPPCSTFATFGEEEAALAAEAAGLQGHFWEMHDVLYREQAFWSYAPNARGLFESYAGTIGLNLDQFRKDIDSEKAKERVDSDHARGDSLGVKLTPTIFINNQPVDPKDKNPEGIHAAINAALEAKSKSGT